MKSFDLKIGRHTYKITHEDRFLDNKACVMLMTQSREKCEKFQTVPPRPILSKGAIKKIEQFSKVQYEYKSYLGNEGLNYFGLEL